MNFHCTHLYSCMKMCVCVNMFTETKAGYSVPYSSTLHLKFLDQLLTTLTHLLGWLASELEHQSCLYQLLQHCCCICGQLYPDLGGCCVSEFSPSSLIPSPQPYKTVFEPDTHTCILDT